LYDMIHPNANKTFTVRSVLWMPIKDKINTYLSSIYGKDFDEIL
jgi:hypothetical protein